MAIDYTPISEIPKIVAASRASFLTHKTQSLEFRKEQVRALQRLVLENEKELLDAIYADLRRSPDFEIPTLTKACQDTLDNLETYTQNQKAPGGSETDDCYVQLNPLGSVLIMGAWNFPVVLLLEPLLGAIAAGNTCVVKPSDVAQTSAKVMTRLIQQYMDPQVVFVINGGPEEATVLLKERFDHIFFTGGTEIGRIVMMAAAKNLTPVTLELGGKCPAVITSNTDIAKAAQRIAFWKTMNCGQVCLSVNYVICPKNMQEALIQNIIGTWQHLFGKDAKTSPAYPRIVNQRQYARLAKVLEASKTQNTVVYGGKTDADDLYIEPTIVTNVSLSDEIMKDELFGPILPIITCDDLDEAIEMINQQEHPLSLTLFSDSKEEVDNVLRKTRSGAVTVNDVASHFGNSGLPFGGVGYSGIGNYHGKYSIETFSHKRAVMIRSQAHL
ncbi:aldehyde dehydrogenase 3, member A2 [Haplosporangium sp. Z 767]|nr:aldehyde dehydrogenase 3, member A2 [Haplosporangium sp. Z 767]KAF9183276.1 aldehyde dehydrogenase 3, member A2 [Haplosporangium sp. Z 11]